MKTLGGAVAVGGAFTGVAAAASTDLVAGGGGSGDRHRGTDVGDVSVRTVDVSGDVATLSVVLTDAWTHNGGLIQETHLAAGKDMAEYETKGWVTSSGNPRPGNFPYSDSDATYETETRGEGDRTEERTKVTYDGVTVSGVRSGDAVRIATHAVVRLDDGKEETAWGEGTRFTERNWAMHFKHTI